MLIFTQFKNSFFQGVIFISFFRIFKWILQENPFYIVYPVFYKSERSNNLQTLK